MLSSRMPPRRLLLLVALCLCRPTQGAVVDAGNAPDGAGWIFRVLLDGTPVGEHRFRSTVSDDGAERTLTSDAAFTVRWLGVPVYRYRHHAVERWRGDCLLTVSADTDDNGQRSRVAAAQAGDVFEVSAPAPTRARGCVMSFAYWNPALRTQQRLLNAQSGRIEPVRVEPIDGRSGWAQRPAGANGWRISGLSQPIDVWYSAEGEWIGLDTRVDGGRVLSYRRP
ncbi:MAG TPA: DUF6134 family protein [Burkholderiaceae bacterium]|nr:DUF6134 family protein [Burkholderiaceae bacterium]